MKLTVERGNNTKTDASILKFYLWTLLVLTPDPLFSASEYQLPTSGASFLLLGA